MHQEPAQGARRPARRSALHRDGAEARLPLHGASGGGSGDACCRSPPQRRRRGGNGPDRDVRDVGWRRRRVGRRPALRDRCRRRRRGCGLGAAGAARDHRRARLAGCAWRQRGNGRGGHPGGPALELQRAGRGGRRACRRRFVQPARDRQLPDPDRARAQRLYRRDRGCGVRRCAGRGCPARRRFERAWLAPRDRRRGGLRGGGGGDQPCRRAADGRQPGGARPGIRSVAARARHARAPDRRGCVRAGHAGGRGRARGPAVRRLRRGAMLLAHRKFLLRGTRRAGEVSPGSS